MSQIFDQLTLDMKESMKNKDKNSLTTIRMAMSAIKQKQIDEKIQITDEVVIAVITKMIKQRQDSFDQYIKANRAELAEGEKREIEILTQYMPKQLSDEEVVAIVQKAIESVGATSMKEMGKIMASVKKELAGRTDMSKVSAIVKSNLA
ncbi:GatB/YqeY domain-containing protein [Francisella tularensis]|uniref:GatB/YqeY domain-containing protein n=1 Tax=Francisella tularensis TaxID=263 RepID=UPI000173E544|nr:GatB/YqeY domain-containing protein [Francisella tularensis]ACD30848.1 GatB/YqeY domain protein [Francisella tularensis subsp. mediasiatica FSC147]MBK2077880.1 GatB/YqeY domain-containing protein [Francisella tularensis subsp. mediasiatica]MBK2101928.1 GatB/YqeY domain-containing protein [Francisella tularensis subsp. mediasiatica]MBK2103907.1 GatB/YqeY domain-containing protein [Francisella tularensis subsp. mediasiatica]MDN9003265.1 GatB/YqeY domain-containing protein [Francisella tularen